MRVEHSSFQEGAFDSPLSFFTCFILTLARSSSSGLGRACVEEICKNGGHAAIFDMNEESGQEVAKEVGSAARFFACNVLETDSIASAVKGAVDWIKETGKTLGGVIPAAGVSTPATVGFCRHFIPNSILLTFRVYRFLIERVQPLA